MALNRISVFRIYFPGVKSKEYKVKLISKTTIAATAPGLDDHVNPVTTDFRTKLEKAILAKQVLRDVDWRDGPKPATGGPQRRAAAAQQRGHESPEERSLKFKDDSTSRNPSVPDTVEQHIMAHWWPPRSLLAFPGIFDLSIQEAISNFESDLRSSEVIMDNNT